MELEVCRSSTKLRDCAFCSVIHVQLRTNFIFHVNVFIQSCMLICNSNAWIPRYACSVIFHCQNEFSQIGHSAWLFGLKRLRDAKRCTEREKESYLYVRCGSIIESSVGHALHAPSSISTPRRSTVCFSFPLLVHISLFPTCTDSSTIFTIYDCFTFMHSQFYFELFATSAEN